MAATSALSKIDITTSLSGPMTMTKTDGGGSISATSTPAITKTISFTYGSASGQALKTAISQGTIAASTGATINLSTITDAFGLAAWTAPQKVRVIALLNTSTAGTDCHLVFGNPGSAKFQGPFGAVTHTLECRVSHPALVFVRLDGWSDDLTTNYNVLITNSSATTQASYQLFVAFG